MHAPCGVCNRRSPLCTRKIWRQIRAQMAEFSTNCSTSGLKWATMDQEEGTMDHLQLMQQPKKNVYVTFVEVVVLFGKCGDCVATVCLQEMHICTKPTTQPKTPLFVGCCTPSAAIKKAHRQGFRFSTCSAGCTQQPTYTYRSSDGLGLGAS